MSQISNLNRSFSGWPIVTRPARRLMWPSQTQESPARTPSSTAKVSSAVHRARKSVHLTDIESGEEPQPPDFKILDVNVRGVIITCKLARYYFKQHELTAGRDRCFIVMSSAAGYGDVPGGPIYMMSKFAARGLMRCIRRTTFLDGIRACALAPW